jgi:hypothetical protein
MLQLNRRTGCLQKRINLGIVNESLSQNKKLGGIPSSITATAKSKIKVNIQGD